MATKIQRAWYIDKLNKIGIVEKASNAVTKDGYSTDWKSLSENKDIRIYTISRDSDITTATLNTATWEMIPSHFHEGIVYKAIASGYKEPRHMDLDVAQYFDNEYLKVIKEAKKFSKSNYQTTGTIKGQDF